MREQCCVGGVFRARFLAALREAGFAVPKSTPKKWVVDCERVGKGITAIKYLSRYLYQGVISENNIVANQNGQVTFRYTESKTGHARYRTLAGEDFLQLILRHVLPQGFRRVRDYGFLHGNAKKLLQLAQLIEACPARAGSSAPTACHEMPLLPDANDYQGVPLHDLEPRLRPHRGWGRRELKQEQNNL